MHHPYYHLSRKINLGDPIDLCDACSWTRRQSDTWIESGKVYTVDSTLESLPLKPFISLMMKYLIPALSLSFTLAGSVSAYCDRKKYVTLIEPVPTQNNNYIGHK